MNQLIPLPAIPLDDILLFIRSYRALEQMPLEDGFAHLQAITPAVPGEREAEVQQLRKHFRDGWYRKERHFGLFYLNLSHYRQLYLLHLWGINDWQDEEYLGTALRNPFFRVAGRPPAKALQLNQLVKYFENHGITYWPHSSTLLDNLPQFDKRFGNSANWPGRRRGGLYFVVA